MAAWLGAGVVPTAVAGAWANVALPESALMDLPLEHSDTIWLNVLLRKSVGHTREVIRSY